MIFLLESYLAGNAKGGVTILGNTWGITVDHSDLYC